MGLIPPAHVLPVVGSIQGIQADLSQWVVIFGKVGQHEGGPQVLFSWFSWAIERRGSPEKTGKLQQVKLPFVVIFAPNTINPQKG